MLLAVVESPDDRRATFGLDGNHARPFGPDEAERLQLFNGFPHADKAGAPAGGIEDDVGHLPAKLLGQLQAHRLLALDPLGLFQRRAVEPLPLLRALGDELAALLAAHVDAVVTRPLSGDLPRIAT